MISQAKSDRRVHPRHFVRILVDYAASDTFLYDYSSDLSEGGIFIQTSTPLAPGEQLDLRFTLPGLDRLFQLRAEVMWVNHVEKDGAENPLAGGDGLDDLLESATETVPQAEASGLPDGMGVRFINITPEEQNLLRQFLDRATY